MNGEANLKSAQLRIWGGIGLGIITIIVGGFTEPMCRSAFWGVGIPSTTTVDKGSIIITTHSVEYYSPAQAGVGIAVTVALIVLIGWLWHSGAVKLRDVRMEGLEELTGPLPGLSEPAPVGDVLAALVRLNGEHVPYRLEIDQSRPGSTARVTVRWSAESGGQKRVWQLKLKLRLRGRYTWHETMRQTSRAGKESAWQATDFRPSDAKRPVFAILRSYGWRPVHDWALLRLFEF